MSSNLTGSVMTLKEVLMRRFEARLQREVEGLTAWDWVAILIAALSGIVTLWGIVMSFDLDDYLMFGWFGVLGGLLLLGLTSPGWGASRAVRRHHKRVRERAVWLTPLRQSVDDLFARARLDEASFQEQRSAIDALQRGLGPGDVARVVASFLRLTGGWLASIGLLLALAALVVLIDFGIDDDLVGITASVALGAAIVAIVGIGFLIIGAGVGREGHQRHRAARAEIEARHDRLLRQARG